MNDRIKTLKEQSGFYKDEYNEPAQHKVDMFAELLIMECISIVENQGKFLKYDVLSSKIKEHFGIKK